MNNTTDSPIDSTITGLLLLINRLQVSGRSLGRETIVPLAEIKLPRVAQNYDHLIGTLLEQGLLEGNAEQFELCPEGLEVVHNTAQRHSLHTWFYNEYYQAILHSRAHALFCEGVYGKDLGQHGMADMEQIQDMLSELEIGADMKILDFGCGDGQIAEYIAEATRTLVTGVDIADEAVRLANHRTQDKRERVDFHVTDREGTLECFSDQSFDRIYAIDSLFFAPDQVSVTRRLLSLLVPGGRMAAFYICPPAMAAAETPFAKTLTGIGMCYRVKDFSAQNAMHWQKKKQVLLELESTFKAEGNEFLFKNRLAECDGLERFQRYLYIVPVA